MKISKLSIFLLPLLFPLIVVAVAVNVGVLSLANHQRETKMAEKFIAVRSQQIKENDKLIKRIDKELDKTKRIKELDKILDKNKK